MPRYYFHVHDGKDFRDTDGVDLPDLSAARAEAVRTSGQMLVDQADRFWTGERWSMDVTDALGFQFFRLMFVAINDPDAPDRH